MINLRILPKLHFVAALALAALPASAGVFLNINIAPPALPYYEQPPCPDDGFIWTPGYWAYGPDGYYWVPGQWVVSPEIGFLWTPPWWGWGGGGYAFHSGYWGPQVGFYGGINYGYGYNGLGYGGGYWRNRQFFYNNAVNNLDRARFHNTYADRSFISGNNRTSFNGGANGVQARATAAQLRVANEHHVEATSAQRSLDSQSRTNRGQLASANGGRPTNLVHDHNAALENGNRAATGEAEHNAALTGESHDNAASHNAATHDTAFTGDEHNKAPQHEQSQVTPQHKESFNENHSASPAERTHEQTPVQHHTATVHPQAVSHPHPAAVSHAGGGHPGGGGGHPSGGGGGGHPGGGPDHK